MLLVLPAAHTKFPITAEGERPLNQECLAPNSLQIFFQPSRTYESTEKDSLGILVKQQFASINCNY